MLAGGRALPHAEQSSTTVVTNQQCLKFKHSLHPAESMGRDLITTKGRHGPANTFKSSLELSKNGANSFKQRRAAGTAKFLQRPKFVSVTFR